MTFISNWVSQIVFFIFLATILSLLIPSTKHDQAIRLVFGLVIFLLFLHPLTQLFNINPNQYVEAWETKISEMMNEDLETEIKSKKSEIQASQHAYILEQLQLEIRELVEKDLQEQYSLDLQTVEISLDDAKELDEVNVDQIKTIKFYVNQKMDNQIQDIEIVRIPNQKKQQDGALEQEVEKMVATKLNLSINQIELIWEGE